MVPEDACATRDLKYGDTTIPAEHVHKAFLAALKTYGKVMKSEEIIALLAAEQEKQSDLLKSCFIGSNVRGDIQHGADRV